MLGWGKDVRGRAARVWVGGLAIALVAVGFAKGDPEAVVFGAVGVVAGALTLVRRGWLGRIAVGLLALDTLTWMAPAAAINARAGESLGDVAVPLLLAALALALLLVVVSVPPLPALVLAAATLIAGAGWRAVSSAADQHPAANATVEMSNVRFTPTKVSLNAGGALAVHNGDLFWHTFTAPSLGIDLRIPTGATRVITVVGDAGDYRVVCAIPGHEQANMVGTLTLR